jgi:hypothetical protein
MNDCASEGHKQFNRPTYQSFKLPNFEFCTPVLELHMAFHVPYICDYITEFCMQQADVIQSHENSDVHDIRKGEAQYGKI